MPTGLTLYLGHQEKTKGRERSSEVGWGEGKELEQILLLWLGNTGLNDL